MCMLLSAHAAPANTAAMRQIRRSRFIKEQVLEALAEPQQGHQRPLSYDSVIPVFDTGSASIRTLLEFKKGTAQIGRESALRGIDID